jgi:hypothetical protein
VKGAPDSDKAPAGKPRPVNSIEEARCKGVEAALAQAFTQPVVCGVAWISLPQAVAVSTPHPDLQPLLPFDADALDKVPIAQA